jgi:hypothetical protein
MRLLSALWVVCGLVFSARALDREAFTFTGYQLNLSIETEQQRLAARGKIRLRNDSDMPQRNITLQISSTLHWVSVQAGGRSVPFVTQTYNSDLDHTGTLHEAIVAMPQAVAPRQSVELEIGYEGTIPPDTTRLTRIGVPLETAKHSDWDEISPGFSAVRGIGYVAWYPIATEAASLSDASGVAQAVGRWKRREASFEMDIEFAQSGAGEIPTLYCNGVSRLESYEQLGAAYLAKSRCTWTPVDLSVPLFVIGKYQALARPVVNISYLPGHKSGAEDYALAVEQIAPWVAGWFGDHRAGQETKAEAVELPDSADLPFESGNLLLTPLNDDQTSMLLSAVQQWTHLVFPSPRTWISDGLAGYAVARYIEQEKGRNLALAYLQSHRAALADAEASHPGESSRAQQRSLVSGDDEFYVQTKAMNVWWMLRDMVGESALTAALHNYQAKDDKDAAYVQKLIEAQARRDLGWFFDDWAYHDRGLPDFRIVSVYARAIASGGYMVTITVENTGNAAAEVPATVRMVTGQATERLVVPGRSKASTRIMAVNTPLEAVVNDGSVPENAKASAVYKIEAQRE